MDFDAQPSSSSASSFYNVETPEKMESGDKDVAVLEVNNQEDKTEDGQEEKKLKEDSIESENQDEVEMKSFIDELPPEMLMQIFKHLDDRSLVNCRLVSRKWNGVAREIIKSSDDVETRFICKETEDGNLKIDGKTERASLEDFINWFADSNESPLYTRFRFDWIKPSVFECEDWLKVISYFGPSVKSLRLATTGDVTRLVEKLRNLLLKQLPNLQEFGLCNVSFHKSPKHQLFPSSNPPVQLPHLKVLHMDERSVSAFTGIFTDLLRAAVNLQRIEPFARNESYSNIKTFQFLQSLGKLHCVQTARIWLDPFMSEIQGQSPMEFKLKKLQLHAISYNMDFCSNATIFLSHLFESSKDTLRELSMDSLGHLPNLQLAKFSKLTKLSITRRGWGQEIQVLPSGINFMETFPVLQFLELQVPWTTVNPHDEDENQIVSCLPYLKSLKITGFGMTKEDVARISQVCPNLKELDLCHNRYDWPIDNFPEVGEAIWTHLKQLEFLNIEIDMDSPANVFPALDSCFTGFSGEDVIRLYDFIKAEEYVENQESQTMIAQSKLEAERKNPSILDLKDLVKLQMSCFSYGYEEDIRKTMLVSEKCAFKLMKNLTYENKNIF